MVEWSRAVEGVGLSTARWVVAGVSLGVAYLASPVVVWFSLAVAMLFVWAGRGLAARERQWVWTILTIAIALRVLAVALLFVTSDHHRSVSFFWDGDGVYMKSRALWIRNVWLGIPITPDYFNRAYETPYGWTQYLNVLAYMEYFLGPAPYGVHLFNVAVYVATCVLLFRLARSAYGREAAFLGLILLLFLPTLFAWSVSALKESVFVFVMAVGLSGLVGLRAPSLVSRAVSLGLLVGSLATVDGLRTGGWLISTAGLGLGLAGSFAIRRTMLLLVALVLLPLVAYQAISAPGVQRRIMSQLRRSAVQHIGNVRTEGHGYKLLDQVLYTDGPTTEAMRRLTPDQATRFSIRAFVAFIAIPLPWQVQSRSELVFLPQQIVWYAIVLLAPVGFVAGIKRDPLLTCALAGLAAIGGVTVALNSGNVGTMIRHRDIIVPFLVWLGAFGAVAATSFWMTPATSPTDVPTDVPTDAR